MFTGRRYVVLRRWYQFVRPEHMKGVSGNVESAGSREMGVVDHCSLEFANSRYLR